VDRERRSPDPRIDLVVGGVVSSSEMPKRYAIMSLFIVMVPTACWKLSAYSDTQT
jgi:hypothetical protein